MSLKLLKVVYYDGEEHVLHVAASDMLHYIQLCSAKINGGKASGNGTHKAPFSGMADRSGWQAVIDGLDPKLEQYIRMSSLLVRKAEKGYYMSVDGIDTHGVTERGGPSYNEFRGLVSGLGKTDAQIANGVRALLTNGIPKLTAAEAALPALTGALFLAEPRRNIRSFAVNLMLLDLIEQNITYGRDDRKLVWDNVLWRDGFGAGGADKTKTYPQGSGPGTALAPHERGGKLPMSHTGASEQSTAAIPAHPPGDTDVFFPNSEMEKEASIVVRWMQHHLNQQAKVFRKRPVKVVVPPTGGATAATGTWASRAKQEVVTKELTFMATYQGLKSGGGKGFGTYLDLNKPSILDPYEAIFAKEVMDALWRRVSTLGLLPLN